jgi:CubicO group peptidase (beta-lactamase class C family)
MGAGGMVSTPSDLTQFIEALFGGKLISPASLEQMKTIQDKYGMGLGTVYDVRVRTY